MKETFTNRQISFMLFGVIVGYGALGLPKNVAEKVGTKGWFTLLIATIITIIFTYILTYLGYVHRNKTIYEYSEILVGKTITYIFITIYIIYFFVLFTMIIRMASETIKLTTLINTPTWVLCLSFLSVVYYAVIKRLGTIAKICEIYGLMIMIGAVFIHSLIFTQGTLINLRPFFEIEDTQKYLKATLDMVFPFLGIEMLTIIPFRKENNKKIFKYTAIMIGFIGVFYILVVESCIAVMGVDSIIYYKDALFATIRRIDIKSLQFLERVDGIFFNLWIMAILCTISLEAYASTFLISKVLKNINFKYITFIVVFLSFIVSQMPTTIDEAEKILEYISYVGILTAGVIPTILFLITKVKKYDKKV